MVKRRKRVKSIPLTIGNDPALWQYASLQEALEDSTEAIAHLIRHGREVANQADSEPVQDAPTSESA